MSQTAGVPAGIRTHHFQKYESRAQCTGLQIYKSSGLYWNVPGLNLGRGNDYPDRGIRGFPTTVQAYDGIK